MKAFLKRDIAKKLGKSPKVIQTWTDMGIVNPDLIPSQGKGISRVYSSLNLLQFAFADELLKCRGVNLSAIKWIMDQIRSETTDEASFFQAIEKNHDGDLLFTGDLDRPTTCEIIRYERSFGLLRPEGSSFPLYELEESAAYLTVNLSRVLENAKTRV